MKPENRRPDLVDFHEKLDLERPKCDGSGKKVSEGSKGSTAALETRGEQNRILRQDSTDHFLFCDVCYRGNSNENLEQCDFLENEGLLQFFGTIPVNTDKVRSVKALESILIVSTFYHRIQPF